MARMALPSALVLATVIGGVGPAKASAQGPQPGARPPQNQVARVVDLMQMMAALPESAPAAPKRPRRVLVLAKAAGFVHSSIPLATRTIEALGQRTGAWTTVITYNAADITAANLEHYDAIFLASTTGSFLDDPADPTATASRRKALLDFIRGGKGLAGIHAATDSYHGAAPGAPVPPPAENGRRPVDGGAPLWPEFNRLIGGYFKWHWLHPTQIAVKIDDPASPINAPFTSVNPQTGVRHTAAVLDCRRGLRLQRRVVVARARARPHQHRLREDAGGSEGAGAGAAATGSRLRPELHPARRGTGRVFVSRARTRRVDLQAAADARAPARGHAVHPRRSRGRRQPVDAGEAALTLAS